MFKIAKRMISQQCIGNEDAIMPVCDADKKMLWKNYQKSPLKSKIAWNN